MGLEGYTLRPVGDDDARRLERIYADEAVVAWLRPRGERGPFSADDVARTAARDAAHWREHGFGRWLVLAGEEPVGHGGLLRKDLLGREEVEIAWAVASRHWGNAIATSIGAAALTAAVEHGLPPPIAFTRTDNAASRRVMEKLGLAYERDFEYAGWPHALYRAPGSLRR